jgi:type IV secretion system protein VirB10
MTTEAEPSVAETPATHKQRTQIFAIALLLLLVVVLTLSTLQRMYKQQAEPKATEVPPPLPTTSTSQREFEERYAQERRRAQQIIEEEAAAAKKESPEEVLARLRKEREQAASGVRSPLDALRSGSGATEKSPRQKWEDDEEMRALNARKAPFKLVLKDDTSFLAPTTPRSAPAPVGPSARRPGIAGERSSLDSEINRVNTQLQQIEERQRQEAEQRDLDASTPDFLGGGRGAGVAPPLPNAGAPGRDGATVGQPASESGNAPKPGQHIIPAGVEIEANLDHDLNSDYLGPWRAIVSRPVYNIDRTAILIPLGATAIGRSLRFQGPNAAIESKMGMTTNRISMPDGSKVSLEKAVGLDQDGLAAIGGDVNRHLLAQFLGVAAYAVLSSGTERNTFNDRSFSGDVGAGARTQFQPLAQKYLSVVPTVRTKKGTPIRIFLEDDIYVYPWKPLYGALP